VRVDRAAAELIEPRLFNQARWIGSCWLAAPGQHCLSVRSANVAGRMEDGVVLVRIVAGAVAGVPGEGRRADAEPSDRWHGRHERWRDRLRPSVLFAGAGARLGIALVAGRPAGGGGLRAQTHGRDQRLLGPSGPQETWWQQDHAAETLAPVRAFLAGTHFRVQTHHRSLAAAMRRTGLAGRRGVCHASGVDPAAAKWGAPHRSGTTSSIQTVRACTSIPNPKPGRTPYEYARTPGGPRPTSVRWKSAAARLSAHAPPAYRRASPQPYAEPATSPPTYTLLNRRPCQPDEMVRRPRRLGHTRRGPFTDRNTASRGVCASRGGQGGGELPLVVGSCVEVACGGWGGQGGAGGGARAHRAPSTVGSFIPPSRPALLALCGC